MNRRTPAACIGAIAWALCSAASLYSAASLGADADDAAALLLADAPAAAVSAARPWQLNLEAAMQQAQLQPGASGDEHKGLLALDGSLDKNLASQLRLVLTARADWTSAPAQSADQTQASVKEAYLSWQVRANSLLDLGRVNLRNGVAIGFNPTDFMREGALGTQVPDPQTRRKYRVGSLMLRAQQLWDSGAVSFAYSPEIAKPPDPLSDPADASDLQRTNYRERWLLSLSQQWGANLRPQYLLYQAAGDEPQLGLNLSRLLNNATLIYGEWSGGRSLPLDRQVAGDSPIDTFNSSSVFGLTYTLPIDVSISLERHTNSSGLDQQQAQARAAANPQAWGQTLRLAANRQQSLSEHTWFLHISARNLFRPKLDVSGFIQTDQPDQGHQLWLEVRQRFDHLDLAVQWQQQRGDPWTRFGALNEERSAKVLVNYYF